MRWVDKWGTGNNVYTTEQAVKSHIEGAPDYHAGQIESLNAQVRALTEWVALLVALLPDSTQREVMPYMTGMKEDD